MSIVDTGVKTAAEIDSQKLIDQHYGSLARLAMEVKPSEFTPTPAAQDAFASAYGTTWSDALGSMMTNPEALASLGVDGLALESMWRGGQDVKLAPGTYIARLEREGDPIYTINGFYPAMRQAFVEPGATVRYLVCEWEEEALPWESFRRDVIGATNPSAATAGSCRALLLSKWQELGLPAEPSMAKNGVHASAGPLEGLKERAVWCDANVASDPLAVQLASAGIDAATLGGWLADNPAVTLGGVTDKVFDLTEEMGAEAVVELVAGSMGGIYAYEATQAIY